jgi:hypothetical protein
MFAAYKAFYKTEFGRPATINLVTRKQQVGDEENKWLEKERVENGSRHGHHDWYKFIGWIP